MPHNERRREARYIPTYGMIAVCESNPMFMGVVLDISPSGMALKSYKKPDLQNGHRRIRLMGPKEMKVEGIPGEILYISTIYSLSADGEQHDGSHRIGIRLTPEKEQADMIHKMISDTM